MATGKFEELAKAPHGEGIIAVTMDTRRGRLYGLTWPSGYFLRYDVAKKELKDPGRISGQGEKGRSPNYRTLCRSLMVDPEDGSVYFTTAEGSILRYRFDRDSIETVAGEDLRKVTSAVTIQPQPALWGTTGGKQPGTRPEERSTECTAIPGISSASIPEFPAWRFWNASPRNPPGEAACTMSSVTDRLHSWTRRPYAVLSYWRAHLREWEESGRQEQHRQGRIEGRGKSSPDHLGYSDRKV